VLCVPTLNPGRHAALLLESVARQTIKPDVFLVVDSSSTDGSLEAFSRAGAELISIPRSTFDHGATRNIALELFEADFYIYLTQDAIPATNDSFQLLLDAFTAPKVGVAYGRQLPHKGADAMGAFARLFNYPAESRTRTLADAPALGIKTAFCSNSFAAYRRTAMLQVDGFPKSVICCEDLAVAARMLTAGWEIRYVADATVYHSHDYSAIEEFRRYFDLGVFFRKEDWIRRKFGSIERQGLPLVYSQLRHLRREGLARRMPEALVRLALRWAGYRLGALHMRLPLRLNKSLAMNRGYWDRMLEQRQRLIAD
jgi:rhamnosyltransferase